MIAKGLHRCDRKERSYCDAREILGQIRGTARRAGARFSRPSIALNRKVVNRNFLLVRYSFERIRKSFKRGELQRRWGGKVTIGKTRSKSEARGKRVRGMAGVVRAGQGACVVGCCEGDSKPSHAKPAYAGPKFSARACRPPAGAGSLAVKGLAKASPTLAKLAEMGLPRVSCGVKGRAPA